MNKFQHKSNNRVLGAPQGWDQQQLPCDALPITVAEWNGMPSVISYWKPTPEELAQLNAGHVVALAIIGETMPPVALYVEAP